MFPKLQLKLAQLTTPLAPMRCCCGDFDRVGETLLPNFVVGSSVKENGHIQKMQIMHLLGELLLCRKDRRQSNVEEKQ
jgi:hypothetical protein